MPAENKMPDNLETEKLSKNLKDWYQDNCPVPTPYYEFFDELAEHVQRLIAEASDAAYKRGFEEGSDPSY